LSIQRAWQAWSSRDPLQQRAVEQMVLGVSTRRYARSLEPLPEEVQRWTAKRRAALVISLLKGETTVAEAARRHGLKVAEVEEWRDRFLLGAENALRARPREDEALREEELNRFKRKVGELTMDLEILQTAARLRPTTPGTSDE
jgi:transposase-like protein